MGADRNSFGFVTDFVDLYEGIVQLFLFPVIWGIALTTIEYFGFTEENDACRAVVFTFMESVIGLPINLVFSIYSNVWRQFWNRSRIVISYLIRLLLVCHRGAARLQ